MDISMVLRDVCLNALERIGTGRVDIVRRVYNSIGTNKVMVVPVIKQVQTSASCPLALKMSVSLL